MSKTKSKFTNKVSRQLSGNEKVFRDELKRMYRPDVVGEFRAIISVKGVDLKYSCQSFDEMVQTIFKVKSQSSITFQITTRTVYVF